MSDVRRINDQHVVLVSDKFTHAISLVDLRKISNGVIRIEELENHEDLVRSIIKDWLILMGL